MTFILFSYKRLCTLAFGIRSEICFSTSTFHKFDTIDKDYKYICHQFLGLHFLLLTSNWDVLLVCLAEALLAEAETEITPKRRHVLSFCHCRHSKYEQVRTFSVAVVVSVAQCERALTILGCVSIMGSGWTLRNLKPSWPSSSRSCVWGGGEGGKGGITQAL